MATTDDPAAVPADAVRTFVANTLDLRPDEIPDHENLLLLGICSLDIMRMASQLRRQGISLPFEDLVADPTLAAWTAHLRAATGDQFGNGGLWESGAHGAH